MQTGFTTQDLAIQSITAQDCATRYPLLILHGVGFRDKASRYYWGRIPAILEKHGARIFLGYQDAWGTYENNARQIATTVGDILKRTSSEKVNIIAHSKGGVDARCLISSLGMEAKIATLTTLSSPHHGAKTLGGLFRIGKPVFKLISPLINALFRKLGDVSPDFLAVCKELSPRYMDEFNLTNPDQPGIYYQHYAAVMNSVLSDLVFSFTYLIIRICDGANDGIVALSSMQYGSAENFKGILYTGRRRGVSHGDLADYRRRPFLRTSQFKEDRLVSEQSASEKFVGGKLADKKHSNVELPHIKVNNIPDFYVGLVADLKNAGY